MTLRSWIEKLSARTAPFRSRKNPRYTANLRLESLEDRLAPALLTVNTAADDLTPNDHTVSLREAITAINASNDLGDPDLIAETPGTFGTNDTIAFSPTLDGHTITLTNGVLSLSRSMTIYGLGADQLTISGNNAATVFSITSGNVTISGLKITAGNGDFGGGIYCRTSGTATLVADDIEFNTAAHYGGGVFAKDSTLTITNSTLANNSAGGFGAGIEVFDASVAIVNSTIANNRITTSSTSCGAGVDVQAPHQPTTAVLESDTLSGNRVPNHLQAADLHVHSPQATATLHNTILNGTALNPAGTPNAINDGGSITSLGHNISSDGTGNLTAAGDLPNTNPLLGTFDFHGGATPTVPTLLNSPAINQGDPEQDAPTQDQRGAIRGAGSGVGATAHAGALPDIGAFEQSSLYLVTTSDATTTPKAYDTSVAGTLRGGVEWANLSSNILVPNTTPNVISFDTAGALSKRQTITLSLAGLTLSNTSVPESVVGSGVTVSPAVPIPLFHVNSIVTSTISGISITGGYNVHGSAGGILNEGTLTLSNVLISYNQAGTTGGGIYNAQSGNLTVTNSTISGNVAQAGGGIYNQGTVAIHDTTIDKNGGGFGAAIYSEMGTVTIDNSTITANSAAAAVETYVDLTLNNTTLALNTGIGLQIRGGTVNVHNTILAGNTGSDVSGTIVSLGSNLIQNPAGGSGFVSSDLLNVNPRLLPLANNGGPTQTLGLGFSLPGDPSFPNNPAVDAGDPTNAFLTDQRSFTRVINGVIDVGAFEDQLILAAPTGSQTAFEGSSQFFNVGSFSDAAPGVASWTIQILWGDGTASTTLTATSQGALAQQAHTYKDEGTYTVTVQVSDVDSDTGQKTFTVSVSDPNVVASGDYDFSASEGGLSTTQPVASFTDPAGPEAVSNYSASINWGDGTPVITSPITVNGNTFFIVGSHTYVEEGSYTITVTIQHKNNTPQTVTDSLTVSDPNVAATGGFSLTALEGLLPATQAVATFTDPAGQPMLSNYSASINWGDGTQASAGTITQPGGAGTALLVAGSHTYAEEGTYTISVTVNHLVSMAQTVTDSATASEVNVMAIGGFLFTASKGTASASQTVATFTDPGGPEATTSYVASINWGDGNSTAGTVTLNQATFTVSGSHTYAATGNYTITVAIAHEGAIPPKVTDQATVSSAGVSATAVNISPTAGAPFMGAVATFTDPAAGPTVSYTASIAWGDNHPPTAATITLGGGVFTVSGNYAYAAAGSYAVTTTIYRQGVPTTIQGTATVASLGQFRPTGMVKPISFWEGLQGQQLVRRFGLTAQGQSLGQWLASTFPNLYGGLNGAANLSPFSNAQIGSYYQSLFLVTKGTGLDAEVLATALEVFATTTSLGGTVGQSFGYVVTDTGLGACSWNIGTSGPAFGVPNLTVLNVFQLLQAANNSAVKGEPWGSDTTTIRNESVAVFRLLNGDG